MGAFTSKSSFINNFKNSLYHYYHNTELIDYITNTNYTNYYRNFVNNKATSLQNFKYYKLYIYINPDVDAKIVDLYKNDAHKKNLLVDSYLEAKNIDISSSKTDSQDFCFDAGFDLYNVENIETNNYKSNLVDHKIQCAMKVCVNGIENYVGYYLYPRSSTGSKTPLRLSNSVGIIDSGYRGNIKACFDNINNSDFEPDSNKFVLKYGERYVQLCPPNLEYPMKIIIVDNLTDLGKETIRGIGGFGSTGQ